MLMQAMVVGGQCRPAEQQGPSASASSLFKRFCDRPKTGGSQAQHLSQTPCHYACPTNPDDQVLGFADDNVLAIRAALAARLEAKAERLSEPRTGGGALWSAVREANWQLPPDWDVPSPVSAVGQARRRLSHAGADMPAGARPIWGRVGSLATHSFRCRCPPAASYPLPSFRRPAQISLHVRSGRAAPVPPWSTPDCIQSKASALPVILRALLTCGRRAHSLRTRSSVCEPGARVSTRQFLGAACSWSAGRCSSTSRDGQQLVHGSACAQATRSASPCDRAHEAPMLCAGSRFEEASSLRRLLADAPASTKPAAANATPAAADATPAAADAKPAAGGGKPAAKPAAADAKPAAADAKPAAKPAAADAAPAPKPAAAGAKPAAADAKPAAKPAAADAKPAVKPAAENSKPAAKPAAADAKTAAADAKPAAKPAAAHNKPAAKPAADAKPAAKPAAAGAKPAAKPAAADAKPAATDAKPAAKPAAAHAKPATKSTADAKPAAADAKPATADAKPAAKPAAADAKPAAKPAAADAKPAAKPAAAGAKPAAGDAKPAAKPAAADVQPAAGDKSTADEAAKPAAASASDPTKAPDAGNGATAKTG